MARRRQFVGWFCPVCRFATAWGDFADLGPRLLMCGGQDEVSPAFASTLEKLGYDLSDVKIHNNDHHEPVIMELIFADPRTGKLA